MTARRGRIGERVAALERVAAQGTGLLSAAALMRAEDVVGHASSRLRHGTDHTVVALAGATGSGKSSLFNALVGEPVAAVGVRRPTTERARAAVFGDAPPAELLGWLGVRDRHGAGAGTDLDGLVLVDLPDHDSVVTAHRIEVDRLIELVDLMVWVLDPQKYADEALHAGYLRTLSRYGEVMLFALNQSDLVPAGQRPQWVAHAESILREDGIESPAVIVTSATTGEGVDVLRTALRERIAARDAALDRLDADLRTIADDLGPVAKVPGEDRRARRDLAAGLAEAAGAAAVGEAVAGGYRHDAVRRTGWPFARWLLRFRRHPLRALRPRATFGVGAPPATAGPVDPARLRLAVKEYADARTGAVPPVWARRMREVAVAETDSLAPELSGAVTEAARRAVAAPRWWDAAGRLQWGLAAAAVAGAAWLAGLAVLGYLRVPTDGLAPEIGGWPIPTLLLLGGAVAGIAAAWLARLVAGIGARRRQRRAVGDIADRVDDIAASRIVAPVDAEVARWEELRRDLTLVAGTR